jgi:alpha-tubulin suppressor-like RCC1 family protein
LGHGNEKNQREIKKIMWFSENGIKIRDIEAGGRHCLAYSSDNDLYGWGFNFYYQLGQSYGNKEDHLTPIKVEISGNQSDIITSM